MNLSLIALAVFSACSDEVENGTHPGKGDQRLSFAVSMGGTNAWKPTAGTRAASGLGESTKKPENRQGQEQKDGSPEKTQKPEKRTYARKSKITPKM